MKETPTENPLRQGLRLERTPEPCTIVIFGASGDLTRRKLVPALYSLAQQNLLPGGFSILGTGRSRFTHEEFRGRMREAVDEFLSDPVDTSVWENFSSGIFYTPTDLGDPQSLEGLAKLLKEIDQERGTSGNRLIYFSTPPSLYVPITQMLGSSGLNRSQGWTRVVVEKPFGHDLASMRELNREIMKVFSEEQVYRIDHYLGKETVQNILVLRFSNGIFEPLWNRRYIDHIQITSAESLGVEARGGYFDQVGTLRDMIQNHLFQIFALIAMEPPASLEATGVRDEKNKVMRAIRPIAPEEVDQFALRGQYGPGAVNGRAVEGYREEQDVAADSCTDTYAAVKLVVDNWRWAGVPFYLRSAKRMPKRVTEVAVQFRKAPHLLFEDGQPLEPNVLALRIQPDEGITLRFGAKLPGQAFKIRAVNMDFRYGTSFGRKLPEAYERLLVDAMLGDSTLSARGDTVELSWKLLTPILEAWQEPAAHFPNYPAGSWGPKESDEFMAKEGRRWRRL
jgi:glucose-6-phosphate 1-dehydrogenase